MFPFCRWGHEFSKEPCPCFYASKCWSACKLCLQPPTSPHLSFLFLLLLWFTPFMGDLIQFRGFKWCCVLRNPKNIFLATPLHRPPPPCPAPTFAHQTPVSAAYLLGTAGGLLGTAGGLLGTAGSSREGLCIFLSPGLLSPIQSLSVASAFSILGPWALLILSHPHQVVLLAPAPHCDLSSVTSQHLYCYHLCLDAIRIPSRIAVSSQLGSLLRARLTVCCSTEWPRWPAKIMYFIIPSSCLKFYGGVLLYNPTKPLTVASWPSWACLHRAGI